MSILVVVAAAAVAASIPLLWWSVAAGLRASARTVDRSALLGQSAPLDLRAATLQRSAHDRAVQPLVGWLARGARRLTPIAWVESLERRITLAGRPPAWPIERVLIAKLALAAAAVALGLLAAPGQRGGLWLTLWAAAVVVAYFTPDLLLYSRGHERQAAIGRELPDRLDQMTIAVEAGLGFEAAMARAGRSGAGPLSDELVRTMQELQVGVPRNRALRNLADRVENEDLRHFVLAVLQAEDYGIPIADILRTQAAEQRVKRRQRAEEHALKIPVKIVFPLVLCILPVLLIVILGPAVIQIVRVLFGPGGL